MKSPVASNYQFRLLFNVAPLVLVTPHSNAGIERVYTLVNKNKAEGTDRNRLDIEGSLSSILTVKLDHQKLFSSATTLNLIKRFCMMLKKQQEIITRCTL